MKKMIYIIILLTIKSNIYAQIFGYTFNMSKSEALKISTVIM